MPIDRPQAAHFSGLSPEKHTASHTVNGRALDFSRCLLDGDNADGFITAQTNAAAKRARTTTNFVHASNKN